MDPRVPNAPLPINGSESETAAWYLPRQVTAILAKDIPPAMRDETLQGSTLDPATHE